MWVRIEDLLEKCDIEYLGIVKCKFKYFLLIVIFFFFSKNRFCFLINIYEF